MKELLQIQNELKAPKGQYNSFGKYKYRSCEDILEAVKPLCVKYGVILTLSDEIVQVGERYYIRATAKLQKEGCSDVSVTAYAREALEKKGMDDSQITGTASSYARKYALNGLFCIDDTKDADTDEYAKKTKAGAKGDTSDKEEWREKVIEAAKAKGIDMKEVAKDYKLNSTTTAERFKEVYEDLTKEDDNAGCNEG
ncbi:ERF family protein [Gallibacter intestinalis]|uniref:ERF family protein n=1 Tax=Gallibacter intestinalis TaxID=2779356 RepID=A0ABR9QXQ5_9FIRM|nr:ERF family protein [Gallibacter intestinalis]MBE5035532.1 ERF family protein [Gallibacter intestinalis]